MEGIGEIFAVPFFGQGHFLPFMELCRQFCSMQYKTNLIISSDLTSSVPKSLFGHVLFNLVEFPTPLPPLPTKWPKTGSGPNPMQIHFQEMGDFIESILKPGRRNPDPTRPIFAVVDNLMCWSKGIFMKFHLPVVAFFAFAAVDVAMEYAAWKVDVENLQPGETRPVPGLPEYMAFNYSDLTIRKNSQPNPTNIDEGSKSNGSVQPTPVGPKSKRKSFPTEPGDEPPWVDDTRGVIAFLINSCDELERPFLDYIPSQIGVRVWAIGPLLPEEYWKCNNSTIFSESGMRPNRPSNYSEEQVIQWLDNKPRRSVIYVSFGSQIAPKLEEHDELANALQESNRPFIWVLQTGPDVVIEYRYPSELERKVGNRGLIIQGWAPQLLILNHPSIGGCLTHSGWNSAMEAIGRRIPTLAWPIRGDQFYNAKSIESHLKVGYIISKRDDDSEIVTKDTIIQGICRLMDDEGVHERVEALRNKVFKHGLSASSKASLSAFKDFISQCAAK